MALPLKKTERRFSYADYCSWPDDERWELIDGVAYCMTPAPTRRHQTLVTEFVWRIASCLHGKPCRAYVAPFDVRLGEPGVGDDLIFNVVQPDVLVYCDEKKMDDRGGIAAPEWVIEVLSPLTSAKDQREKKALYERYGVQEYWLAHPTDRTVTVYRREEGGFGKPEIHDEEGRPVCALFPDLSLPLAEIFSILPGAL